MKLLSGAPRKNRQQEALKRAEKTLTKYLQLEIAHGKDYLINTSKQRPTVTISTKIKRTRLIISNLKAKTSKSSMKTATPYTL
jgi:hypothetical protein